MEYVIFNYMFYMHISFGSGILVYKLCVNVWNKSYKVCSPQSGTLQSRRQARIMFPR